MIIYKENFAIYVHDNSENIVYNRITNSAGDCYYPDMLINSNSNEAPLASDTAHEAALTLHKKYGSAGCAYISYKDESFIDHITECMQKLHSSVLCHIEDEALIDSLADDLALSATMKSSFKWLLAYYNQISSLSYYINQIRSEYELPVKNKQEGKRIYESIRKYVLRS